MTETVQSHERSVDELTEFVDEAYWIIRKTFFGVGVSNRRMDEWIQRWLDAGRDCAAFLPEQQETASAPEPPLYAKLRQYRIAAGLTQMFVAGELGIARTTLVAIEKGERKLRADELVRMAQLYGVQIADLIPIDEVSHD